MSYAKSAIRGVGWVSAFRYSTRGIAFFRTILLARILTPQEFGVVGIATLVLSFLEILTETGINVFLIQKRDEYKAYLNTAWVVSIIRGIGITLLILVFAKSISNFFNSPASYSVLLLIAAVPFIRAFINPSIVEFQKDLKFGKEFWFRFVIFAFDSTIAVVFALVTKNAASIVLGLIFGAVLELVMSFVFLRPKPKFVFDPIKIKEIVKTGKWLTGAGIFQFLFRQGDDAVVGKLLGEGQLGLYQVGYKISSLPITEVTDVFNRVALPLYVKISSSKKRLYRAFLINSSIVVVLATIVGTTIFVFADPLVRLALGEKWLEVIPLLKILSIFGIIQAITNSVHSLLLALEKQKYVTILTGVSVIGLGVSIIPLTLTYGIIGSALAPLIGTVLAFPIMLYVLSISLKELHE